MGAQNDFDTALNLQLLSTTEPAVGLTDSVDLGWTGRYDIVDTVQQVTIHGLKLLQSLPYTEHYISQPLAGRPDLLAESLYNNAELSWILKLANNITRNDEFTTSRKIRVPLLENVETAFLVNRGGI